MADESLLQFFLQPSSSPHRQYEALRAVFVEKRSQKETAARFGYSYGAFRQLMLQFRNAGREGSPPPFLPNPVAARSSIHPNDPSRLLRHKLPLPMLGC